MSLGNALSFLAALCVCGPAVAASFDLPEIPLALRPLLEARIYNASAVATSLPAHPMAPAFLDSFVSFLVDGMEREKIDPKTALRLVCTNFGDKDIGIFAVDCYASRHGLEDGFLAWLAEAHGDLRASCRAQVWLKRAGQDPHAPPSGRGAVFARLQMAASLPSSKEAAVGSLRAWAEAVDSAQARSAGIQARFLLDTPPLDRVKSVLLFDPAPSALLAALAETLEDPAGFVWLTALALPDPVPPPPGSLAPSAVAAGHVSQFVGHSASAQTALKDFDAIAATLPREVQAYLALPVAQQLIKNLDLDAAEARLEDAARLDARGAWREPIASLRRQCRAGKMP